MKLHYLTLKQVSEVIEAAEMVMREIPDGSPIKSSGARGISRRTARNRLFDAVVTLSDNARHELTSLMCLGRDSTQTTLADIFEITLDRPNSADNLVERAPQIVAHLRTGLEKI